jgi:hypothetical protein
VERQYNANNATPPWPDSQFHQISIRVYGELATWPEAGWDVTVAHNNGVLDTGQSHGGGVSTMRASRLSRV